MTKNRTPTPVYLDPGMHAGLEVKGLIVILDDVLEMGYGQNHQIFKLSYQLSLNQIVIDITCMFLHT